MWTFVAPFFNFRFESFYLVFIVTIVELGAFVDQGFGRWPVQYNTREAASAKGDYYLNPFCTHFLLPAKSEKFDGMKLEYDKSIAAQTPTVSTAKFRSDLEEYIRRGRFKRNKPGTQGSRPSFLCPRDRRSGAILFLSCLSFCHSVILSFCNSVIL